MNHKEIRDLIGAYVDGELHGEERKAVEEHIKTCAECSREVEYIAELNERIRGERISLPQDAYWEAFPGRVLKRANEQPQRSFFAVWLPRMKWELAGGIVLLLLTFVVSKQLLMERSAEIGIDRSVLTEGEKLAEEEGWIRADGDETASPVAGKAMDEIAKKEKVLKGTRTVSAEEGGAEALLPDVAGEDIAAPKSAATIAKVADKDDEPAGEDGLAGAYDAVIAKGGRPEEAPAPEANKEVAFHEETKAPEKKAEEPGMVGDLESERDEGKGRFAQVSERSQNVRRGLLRLLYNEAGRTRKRADIERAMREIEFYQDSYPEDFQDTLLLFSDSLQVMIEEVEKQEAEQVPAEETETK